MAVLPTPAPQSDGAAPPPIAATSDRRADPEPALVGATAAAPPQPGPAPASQPAHGWGLGSLLSLAIAAVACFGFGWLGYQLVTSLRKPASSMVPLDLLTPASPDPRRPVQGRTPLQNPAVSPAQAPLTAALQCLAGGRGEVAAPADPTNYGPRLPRNWQGKGVPNTPALIVLHETVVDEPAALALFQRRHSDDGQQASYHVLIGRDGRRVRVVDDAQRAFGAGDSAFENLAVQLKPGLRPSVNNIALHVSLVSPPDGRDGEGRGHGGYTAEQYRSLASQIALWQASYGIPASRVVTHQEVDRSGSRRDPRSFDWQALGLDLRQQWLACGGSASLAALGR